MQISLRGRSPVSARKEAACMIAGYLKPGAESVLIEFREQFNEHLSQPLPSLVALGALRDPDGQRRGYLGFVEADSLAEAAKFLYESPYYQADLYERTDVFEYWTEVGQIG